MHKPTFTFGAALALFANQASAAIAENGIWTDNDYHDAANNIRIINGVPTSDDAVARRRINAPLSVDGPIDDIYLTMENVQRIQRLFSEAMWEEAFPYGDPLYTLDSFLRGAAKFPYFCNETNIEGMSVDDTCLREIASMFAHWGQETGKREPGVYEFWQQALYFKEELGCDTAAYPACAYQSPGINDIWWPNVGQNRYYGRGPFQLSYNYNYGPFSTTFTTSTYDSKMYLLRAPQLVAEDGAVAMAAAIWFYMTPQAPKPSMHDVMTGFFIPNENDIEKNITASFGTTTNIINGGVECGGTVENSKSASRGEYYLKWLDFFDLPAEGGLGCANQSPGMLWNGTGGAPMYWEQDWQGRTRCNLVDYYTPYFLTTRDDYKRCVCDLVGEGESDCPTDPNGPAPFVPPEDSPDIDPQPIEPVDDDTDNDGWKTDQTLEEIRANPHYPDGSYSRTMYQVDRELDFIEEKLLLLFEKAGDAGLL